MNEKTITVINQMKVKLLSITPNAEEHIVEVARVSSSRENKKEDYESLIRYLIKHKHWSPFEHSYMTVEIETSKAIAIQLLRHRSFTFQEFSQRYQNVNALSQDGIFEPIQLRWQAQSNRQSSTDPINSQVLDSKVAMVLAACEQLYNNLLESGVSRETARFVLPMATKTTLHMTGSIRSWIHFIQIRDDSHAQKEIQDVAKCIKSIFADALPVISESIKFK
jgi:thymidylate synthase (FAD)